MPTGKDFTEEQWREIYAARARLEAYRNKIQPYPAYPNHDETHQDKQGAGQPREVIHRTSNMGRAEFILLQQTARKADWLEKKLLEKEKPRQAREPKTAPRVYEVES